MSNTHLMNTLQICIGDVTGWRKKPIQLLEYIQHNYGHFLCNDPKLETTQLSFRSEQTIHGPIK